MNPNDLLLSTSEMNSSRNYQIKNIIMEGLCESIPATPIRPPNLHLVKCCCRCRYARPEGLSIECRKFVSRGITPYAICDDYEEPVRHLNRT
jgi:hypothetical protein